MVALLFSSAGHAQLIWHSHNSGWRLLPLARRCQPRTEQRDALCTTSALLLLSHPGSTDVAYGAVGHNVTGPFGHSSGRGPNTGGRARGRSKGPTGDSRSEGGRQPVPILPDDLPSLAALVEQHSAAWSQGGNVSTLRAAFNKLGKVGSPLERSPTSRRATITTFQLLAAAYLPHAPRLRDAYSCVTPLWTCAKMSCWQEGEGLVATLLQRLQAEEVLRAGWNGTDHANLWWSVSLAPCSIVALAAAPLATSAASLLEISSEQLKSQEWSNILLACARLRYGSTPALLDRVTACLAAKQDARNQHLANAIYSLGELAVTCGYRPRSADLQLLVGSVVARLGGHHHHGQQQQGFAPSPWQQGPQGAAKAGSSHPEFLPQELSNMLLGCAKLRYDDPTLLRPLAVAARRAAGGMKTQELANSLYALGKLGCSDPVYAPVVAGLCFEAHQRLQDKPADFVPQELANMLWTLAVLRPAGWEGLCVAVAEECRRREFAGFNAQELSSTVWALAKLGWAQDQSWYRAAVAAALQPGTMAGANSQDWSNLWYGLALVRHRPPEELLGVMVTEQSEAKRPHSRGSMRQQAPLDVLRSGANNQECANLLLSLAVLGLYEQRLVEVLVERLLAVLEDAPTPRTGQELSNSLWALAVMGPDVLAWLSPQVETLLGEVVRLWEEVVEAGHSDSGGVLVSVELAQLWQVQQELVHVGRDGGDADGGGGLGQGLQHMLPMAGAGGEGSLMAAMQEAAQQQRLETELPAAELHCQVVTALGQLKDQLAREAVAAGAVGGRGGPGRTALIRAVRAEYVVWELCCRVDVVVEMAGGRRVAVEVDGPTHFMANYPHRGVRTGPTQLRDRQLERVFGAGNAVSVPYWEWRPLASDEERCRYLRALLGL